MNSLAPPLVDPARTPAADLAVPDPLDLSFEGFTDDTFGVLDRLKANPHIKQYREEKPLIDAHLKGPFKRLRDDLVVNLVLPNRLDFETEKNVFSRLLKNDFGAGGCHHHLWMAFYRPGRRRLTDLQLSLSLSPDGLAGGLFVGAYAKDLLRQARARALEHPERFLSLVNPLLGMGDWHLSFYRGSGKSKSIDRFKAPLDRVPEAMAKADGIWTRTTIPRAAVLARGGLLVEQAMETWMAVWPLYRFFGR